MQMKPWNWKKNCNEEVEAICLSLYCRIFITYRQRPLIDSSQAVPNYVVVVFRFRLPSPEQGTLITLFKNYRHRLCLFGLVRFGYGLCKDFHLLFLKACIQHTGARAKESHWIE